MQGLQPRAKRSFLVREVDERADQAVPHRQHVNSRHDYKRGLRAAHDSPKQPQREQPSIMADFPARADAHEELSQQEDR